MYARVVLLGATKSVPFREVSSIQGCPYRGVPLYSYITSDRHQREWQMELVMSV